MVPPPLSESRSLLLDLLRFLLALIVAVGHGFGFFHGYFGGFFPEVFPHPQSIAVVAFFYLSGFLVVGSQLDRAASGRAGLGSYLFDRVTRVYVTLLPCLVFVALVDQSFRHIASFDQVLVRNYGDLQRLFKNLLLIPSMPYGTMRPIWSLMYEWWIYLLFGGMFFFRRSLLPAAILVVTGAYYTLMVNGRGEAGHIWIVWLVGAVCAHAQRRWEWDRLPWPVHLSATVLFAALAFASYWVTKHAYNLTGGVCLALALFFLVHLGDLFSRWLLAHAALVRALAGLSFTLFLTHYTVMTYVREYAGLTGLAGMCVGLVASAVIAYAIAYCTEYRLHAVKSWTRRLGTRMKTALSR